MNSRAAATAVAISRLLILTGARRSEIEGLKWSEVDFQFGMLRKETSKTGAKVIPRARRSRSSRSRGSGPPAIRFGFPGQRGEGHFDSLNKEWSRIRIAAGISDVRVHDLRHTYASFGAAGGIGLPLIGGILGHREASTSQRYAHLADTPVRATADVIAGEIGASLFRGM